MRGDKFRGQGRAQGGMMQLEGGGREDTGWVEVGVQSSLGGKIGRVW